MVNRSNDFTKPIPISEGGTGATTAAGARADLGITIGARDIIGTANQILVINGDGVLGDPQIRITPNPIIPGAAAVTAPIGATADRSGSPSLGMIRGNTDTGLIEGFSNNEFSPFNLPFSQLQFVAKTGDDLNSGTTFNAPKLTIQAAIDAVGSGGLVWVLDSGTYIENLTITYGIQIYAYSAALVDGGNPGDLITISGGGSVLARLNIANVSQSGAGLAVNVVDPGTVVFLDCAILFGNVDIEGDLILNNIAQIASALHVLSTGILSIHDINCIFCTFTFDPGSTVVGNIQVVGSQNTIYGNQNFQNDVTISNAYKLPTSDGTPNQFMQTNGSGIASWADAAMLPYNGFQIYVSQIIGSDVTGDGSINKPLATIGAAITLAGTPLISNPAIIIVMDGATYDESLSITNDFIFLTGNQYVLDNSGAGNTVTVGPNVHFNMECYKLSCTGGAFALSTSGDLSVLKGFEIADPIENTSTGGLVIFSSVLESNITSTGGGITVYECPARAGTDGAGVIGISATGTSNDSFLINNQPAMPAIIGTVDLGSNLIYSDPIIDFSSLALGGQKVLFTASTGATYKVRNMRINFGTAFSGGGGDRDITITDGTTVYSVMPAAQLMAPFTGNWGSAILPLSATVDVSVATVASTNLYAVYSGGTTDYAAGSLPLTIEYERVT